MADLPYFNPHSFRDTLVSLAQKLCQTPEEYKSWSQNLGHENVLTTFTSYGAVQHQRQGEIFQELKSPREVIPPNVTKLAKALAYEMQNNKSL